MHRWAKRAMIRWVRSLFRPASFPINCNNALPEIIEHAFCHMHLMRRYWLNLSSSQNLKQFWIS
jgi:hypothetical protein